MREQQYNQELENAIKILIKWIGDDPNRDGLLKTPQRLLAAYKEYFRGYNYSPQEILSDSVLLNEGCQEMILLTGIEFLSHCEHHIAPIKGEVSIAYIPHNFIIGISRIIKLIDVLSRRLQIQERLTVQIADNLYQCLKPKGVAILLKATHGCISCIHSNPNNILLHSQYMLGVFKNDFNIRNEFFSRIK